MANSRNSRSPSDASRGHLHRLTNTAERALEDLLARVMLSEEAAPAAAPVAVAYSGGLDSTVLLHLAHRMTAARGIPLIAFHVHHGLSPHADRWLAHCAAQTAALGVAFDHRRVEVHQVAGQGVEQAARLARYAALRALCDAHQVRWLLLAHHQDDQAETVLLQLLRGAGVAGLGGMAVVQTDHPLLGSDITLARPLLDCTRTHLEDFAHSAGWSFIEDESNADTHYRRNALRHELSPVLDQHFPGHAATLARSARHLQSAQRLLEALAGIDLQSCAVDIARGADPSSSSQPAASVGLDLARLAKLPAERIDNLLRHWLQLQGARYSPSDAQLAQLRSQMLGARDDAHPQLLLCGLMLVRQGGCLLAREAVVPAFPPQAPAALQWRGEPELIVPGWQGKLCFEVAPRGLDRDRLLRGSLSLRPRSGRERLKLEAHRPSRSLKNLYQELQVPAQVRPWLPLLYLDEELVFAAGLGVDVRSAVDGGLRVRWQPEPDTTIG